jgi:hypothetical protein
MNFVYPLKTHASTIIDFDDFSLDEHDTAIILAYHINTTAKYPFLQFALQKIPEIPDIMEEHYILPYVQLQRESNIHESLQTCVESKLTNLENNFDYQGVLIIENIPFIFVEVFSNSYNDFMHFALTTEIINTGQLYNVAICNSARNIFLEMPQLGLLYKENTQDFFPLPDVAFTTDSEKDAEFKSVFNNIKTKIYPQCREYYYFYRGFQEASNKRQNIVSRFAVFIEGKMVFENEENFSLKDSVIDQLYPEPCIIICYTFYHSSKENLLVKTAESFAHLSSKNIFF